MNLPDSLSVFIRSTQAKLFGGVVTDPIRGAQTQPASSDRDFGIGGIYDPDTETLTVTIAQLPDGVVFSTLVFGSLALYRILDAASDFALQEVDLDPALLKFQPKSSSAQMWEVRISIDVPPEEVVIGCVLRSVDPNTGTSSEFSGFCPVQSLEPTIAVSRYVERYRPQIDSDDPHAEISDVEELTVTEHEDAENVVYEFDFTKESGSVNVTGDGVVAYAGGGNRWLPAQDPEGQSFFVMQEQNQIPWELPARLVMESGARNYITDPTQSGKKFKTSSKHQVTVTQQQFDIDAFYGYRAIGFAVSGSLSLNNVFEYESEAVALADMLAASAAFVTGSALLETTLAGLGSVTGGVRKSLKWSIGIRLRGQTQAIVTESYSDLGTGVPVFDIAQHTSPIGSAQQIKTQYPDAVSVSLVIRCEGICPGDRFTFTVAAPQIQDSHTAGARLRATSQMQPDTITIASETARYYENSYGMFTMRLIPFLPKPALHGGSQMLFTTQTQNNGPGFWCRVWPTGSVEFGCVDADNTVFVISTDPVTLPTQAESQIQCAFTMQALQCSVTTPNGTVTKSVTLAQELVVPDLPVLRIGSDHANAQHYHGEVLSFKLESRSLALEAESTIAGLVTEFD